MGVAVALQVEVLAAFRAVELVGHGSLLLGRLPDTYASSMGLPQFGHAPPTSPRRPQLSLVHTYLGLDMGSSSWSTVPLQSLMCGLSGAPYRFPDAHAVLLERACRSHGRHLLPFAASRRRRLSHSMLDPSASCGLRKTLPL